MLARSDPTHKFPSKTPNVVKNTKCRWLCERTKHTSILKTHQLSLKVHFCLPHAMLVCFVGITSPKVSTFGVLLFRQNEFSKGSTFGFLPKLIILPLPSHMCDGYKHKTNKKFKKENHVMCHWCQSYVKNCSKYHISFVNYICS